MKKLQITIMVLMLCLGTAAKAADPIASYHFNGSLADGTNGYDGQWCYPSIWAYDPDGPPPGGWGLRLNGDNCVILPLGSDNPFDHSADFSVVMWFKIDNPGEGDVLISSSRDDTPANHSYAVFMNNDGGITADMFHVGTVETDSTGLDDGTWHHLGIVFEQATTTTTFYIDGAEDGSGTDIDGTIPNIEQDTLLVGDTLNDIYLAEDCGECGGVKLVGSIAQLGIYDVALDAGGVATAMSDGFSCCGPMHFLRVDPNTMTVYEEGETIGDFDVSLNFAPLGQGSANQGDPYTITVTIDPDGGNGEWGSSPVDEKDIQLLAGMGPNNQVTLTFDPNNWDIPQTVLFKAIDDPCAEPPDLDEITNIGITVTSTVAEPNLNEYWGEPWSKNAAATVWDNDQADILFTYTPPEMNNPKYPVTGPIQLWEQPRWFFGVPLDRWRKIGVTLQVPPSGGPVKLQAVVEGEIEGDNLPLTDPCLPYEESDEPNGLIFTAANYNVSQDIKIGANNDYVLQAVGATAAGDEDYQANLVFTVIDDGGDDRFTGMERTVQFNIEDDECGAWGFSYLDVGNPNAFGDPNFRDEDGNPLPDCYIDIYDVIEMAVGWLRCTNPQDENCWSML